MLFYPTCLNQTHTVEHVSTGCQQHLQAFEEVIQTYRINYPALVASVHLFLIFNLLLLVDYIGGGNILYLHLKAHFVIYMNHFSLFHLVLEFIQTLGPSGRDPRCIFTRYSAK